MSGGAQCGVQVWCARRCVKPAVLKAASAPRWSTMSMHVISHCAMGTAPGCSAAAEFSSSAEFGSSAEFSS